MARFQPSAADLWRGERGLALTEFTIIIPVVLLFFFAMLQYFETVKAAQLANYAAYVAARVYAVRVSIEGDAQAQETATKAAALAMAPVADVVPGEIGGFGGGLSGLLPADFPGPLKGASKIATGFLVAQNLRLKNSLGGGGVTFTTSGDPKQVDVAINYPQPIYIPGLAEMWALVAGDRGIHHNLKSLREGIGGVPGSVLPVIETSESSIFSQFGIQPINLSSVMFPYINIRGKCSMGISDWGSKNPEYRPRLANTVQDAGVDPETAAKLANGHKIQEAQKEYQAAADLEKQRCQDWADARTKLAQAQATRDQVFNDPNSTQDQRDAAQAALDQAKIDEQNAHAAYDTARQDRIGKQQTLESLTNKDVPDIKSCE